MNPFLTIRVKSIRAHAASLLKFFASRGLNRVAPLVFVLALYAASALVGPPSGLITLAWSYPSNLITPDLSFVITASTNLAVPITD